MAERLPCLQALDNGKEIITVDNCTLNLAKRDIFLLPEFSMAHVEKDDDPNNSTNVTGTGNVIPPTPERLHLTGNAVSDHPLRGSKTFRQRVRNHRNLRIVMDHLDHRNHDPNEILTSLGFQPEMAETRIPNRFLHDSNLKGINFDYRYVVGKILSSTGLWGRISFFVWYQWYIHKVLNGYFCLQRLIQRTEKRRQDLLKCRECNPVIESRGDSFTTQNQRSDDNS